MKNGSTELDQKILAAIALGNQKEFRRLFDFYYEFVIQISCLYVSFHDAEEISIDIFSKLWDNRQQLPEIDSLRNYLFILTKNKCLSHLKRKKIETAMIEDVYNKLSDLESTPHTDLEIQELNQKLEQVISKLPTKCREAFRLVKEEGLCYKEAAQRMHISENTLDAHLKKATKSILVAIREYRAFLLVFLLS